MTRRVELLMIIAASLVILGFHFRLKKDPDYKVVDELVQQAQRPRDWMGKYPPELDVTTIDGKRFRLSEHVGQEVIILNFFATWCEPCRAEMPELQRFQSAHARDRVTLIGLDANESVDLVKRFRTDLKLTFPIAIVDGKVLEQFGINSYPTTIVIAPDGKVRLFELSAIANADVTLEPIVREGAATIAKKRGISQQEFIRLSSAETRPVLIRTSTEEKGPKLTGRALQIASTMNCVCGCSDKVSICKCHTATKIKEKLAKGEFGNKTDAQIKTELNAEYCMKEGM